MDYFSNLMIDSFSDDSYPSVELQLKFLIAELKSRLEVLSKAKSSEGDYVIPEEELTYVLPEHFTYVSEIEKAIRKAEHQLSQEMKTRSLEEYSWHQQCDDANPPTLQY